MNSTEGMMPEYKVPATKPFSSSPDEPKPYQPSVHIPMKPEWLKKTKVGDEMEITLHGKIVGTELSENDDRKTSEVRMEIDSVGYYPTDKNAKVLMEEDEDT